MMHQLFQKAASHLISAIYYSFLHCYSSRSTTPNMPGITSLFACLNPMAFIPQLSTKMFAFLILPVKPPMIAMKSASPIQPTCLGIIASVKATIWELTFLSPASTYRPTTLH